jgi:hypothetical protein
VLVAVSPPRFFVSTGSGMWQGMMRQRRGEALRQQYLMELSLKGKNRVERVTYRSQIMASSARRPGGAGCGSRCGAALVSRARRSQEIGLAEEERG